MNCQSPLYLSQMCCSSSDWNHFTHVTAVQLWGEIKSNHSELFASSMWGRWIDLSARCIKQRGTHYTMLPAAIFDPSLWKEPLRRDIRFLCWQLIRLVVAVKEEKKWWRSHMNDKGPRNHVFTLHWGPKVIFLLTWIISKQWSMFVLPNRKSSPGRKAQHNSHNILFVVNFEKTKDATQVCTDHNQSPVNTLASLLTCNNRQMRFQCPVIYERTNDQRPTDWLKGLHPSWP